MSELTVHASCSSFPDKVTVSVPEWRVSKSYFPRRFCRNLSDAGFGFKCSECGFWEDIEYNEYCPHCGARVLTEEQGHLVADAIRRLEEGAK